MCEEQANAQSPLQKLILCNNNQNFLKCRYQSIFVCPILLDLLTFFQIFCHRLSPQANLWSWLVPVHFKPQYLYTFNNFEVFLKSLMEIWAERVAKSFKFSGFCEALFSIFALVKNYKNYKDEKIMLFSDIWTISKNVRFKWNIFQTIGDKLFQQFPFFPCNFDSPQAKDNLISTDILMYMSLQDSVQFPLQVLVFGNSCTAKNSRYLL